jgi:hypothetical protein
MRRRRRPSSSGSCSTTWARDMTQAICPDCEELAEKVCYEAFASAPWHDFYRSGALHCANLIHALPTKEQNAAPDAAPGIPEPVAYVVQTIGDDSIGDTIAPVRYLMFKERLAKLQDDPWVKAGKAVVAPLYDYKLRAYATAEHERAMREAGESARRLEDHNSQQRVAIKMQERAESAERRAAELEAEKRKWVNPTGAGGANAADE